MLFMFHNKIKDKDTWTTSGCSVWMLLNTYAPHEKPCFLMEHVKQILTLTFWKKYISSEETWPPFGIGINLYFLV